MIQSNKVGAQVTSTGHAMYDTTCLMAVETREKCKATVWLEAKP